MFVELGHSKILVMAQRAGVSDDETPQIVQTSHFICSDDQVPDTSQEEMTARGR
jgi:hypothetical protein